MLSIMKKILSKICMFGLSTTMSFGFGSFLSGAVAPDDGRRGGAIVNNAEAQITLRSGLKITISGIVGTENYWDGTNKQLVSQDTCTPGTSAVKLLMTGVSQTPIDITNNIPSFLSDNVTVYVSASTDGITGFSYTTNWVPLIEYGVLDVTELSNLVSSIPGVYKFYYYVVDEDDPQMYSNIGVLR